MKIIGIYPSSPRHKYERIVDIECEKCGHVDAVIAQNSTLSLNYVSKVKCKKCEMENKRYYTPNVEDLHIGYEYEQFSHLRGTWDKKVLDYNEFISILDEERNDWCEHHIRTPFLNREQIEKEGWEIKEGYLSSPPHNCVFTKGNMMGAILVDDRLVLAFKDITEDKYTEYMSQGQIFLGKCPSINEFRKIIKLLEINGK